MDDYYNDGIVRLIQLYQIGEISERERHELEEWCRQKKENRQFFERVCRERLFAEERPVYNKINDKKALRVFERKVGQAPRRIGTWWKYVAILIFVISIAGVWMWGYDEGEEPLVVASSVGEIHPGSSQAVLILDDGQKVVLKDREEGEILAGKGVKATREKDMLVYMPMDAKRENPVRFNELEIPRGGEYKVILADGTVVYLNSATRLKYPVVFNGKERKVYLSGEAYFEVMKDSERPFLVEVGGIEVKVYGTSFNISSRPNGDVRTILVHGKVSVRVVGSTEENMIKPGQMAEYNRKDQNVDEKEVDVALYTDWKDGIFRFENQRLEDILTTLSNWYDVDIFYQTPSVKDLHFSGYMERYKEIDTILKAITLSTDVQFTIRGRTIVVSK